jgi:signal-transduction protein with cAMP-binding, CBS, and nucleotidyltransferase domain
MLQVIPYLRSLSENVIRQLWLELNFAKFTKGSIIIRYGEKNWNTYFVEEGTVEVYVFNEMNSELYFFQKIHKGGAFNFVNSTLNHYSLFTIIATTFCKVATIHSDNIQMLKSNGEIHNVFLDIKAKYM